MTSTPGCAPRHAPRQALRICLLAALALLCTTLPGAHADLLAAAAPAIADASCTSGGATAGANCASVDRCISDQDCAEGLECTVQLESGAGKGCYSPDLEQTILNREPGFEQQSNFTIPDGPESSRAAPTISAAITPLRAAPAAAAAAAAAGLVLMLA